MKKNAYNNKLNFIILSFILLLTILSVCFVPENIPAAERTAKQELQWDNAGKICVMEPGETKKFQVKNIPSDKLPKDIIFKSSNEETASVDKEGNVMAKIEGEAVITAEIPGSYQKTLKCRLYVGKRVKTISWSNSGKMRTVEKGEKFRFKIKLDPTDAVYKKVKYFTSSQKTVSVSKNGTVEGLKKGSAVVKAVSEDGSNVSVSCKVTVGTRVQKLKWKNANSKMNIKMGDSYLLKLIYYPKKVSNKKVSYYSSDPKVAAINSKGRITAKKKGVTFITAASMDGSNKRATVKISVKNPLDPQKTHFIAHRGMKLSYPENTVQAFQAAAEQNFWGIECDVWETRKNDGSIDLMVMHDTNILRMCGYSLPIQFINMQNRDFYPVTGGRKNDPNLIYKIPDLSEYIDAVSPEATGKELVIELKDRNLSKKGAEAVFDVLAEKKIPSSDVTFISFGRDTLKTLKDAAASGSYDSSDADFWLLMKDDLSENEIDQYISWCKENGMKGLSVCEVLKDSDIKDQRISYICSKLKENGLACSLGAIDDVLEAKKYVEMGVTEITTNSAIWKK